MNRLRLPIAILVASAFVAVGVGFASSKAATSTGFLDSGRRPPSRTRIASVYTKVSPSVVQIQTSEGLGSGIVFDSKGDIVTNDHVVGSSKTFTVTTSTGKQLKGTLVGAFAGDDLAVIKVDGTGLRPAQFANSDAAPDRRHRDGDRQPARAQLELHRGHRQRPRPPGARGQRRRSFRARSRRAPRSTPATRAAPSSTSTAQVIGIPTLAAADPQLGGAAAGIGFAIPSNVVTNIAGQLVKPGQGDELRTGPSSASRSPTRARQPTASSSPRCFPDTAAAKAGLKTGERITPSTAPQTPPRRTSSAPRSRG